MAVDKQHLRQIAQNAVSPIGAVAVGIGGVVPANRIRQIYFVKVCHNNAISQIVSFWRDGAAAVIALDTQQVPGFQVAGQTGKPYAVLGKDIEMPVYILREGEEFGADIPAGIGYVFLAFYDEEG